MNDYAEVIVLVEGITEQRFIKDILAPYFYPRSIFLKPIIVKKAGEPGGDVKFARVKNDIEIHLKQRSDTWLTLLIDYYGIHSDWPGYEESKKQSSHALKAKIMCQHTARKVNELFAAQDACRRFIPYVSMHEFEALLFSNPDLLASKLGSSGEKIETILKECGEPEAINDNPHTAPSKRLKSLSPRFKKTTTGIEVALSTGIPTIRQACPIFNEWLGNIESLAGAEK